MEPKEVVINRSAYDSPNNKCRYYVSFVNKSTYEWELLVLADDWCDVWQYLKDKELEDGFDFNEMMEDLDNTILNIGSGVRVHNPIPIKVKAKFNGDTYRIVIGARSRGVEDNYVRMVSESIMNSQYCPIND